MWSAASGAPACAVAGADDVVVEVCASLEVPDTGVVAVVPGPTEVVSRTGVRARTAAAAAAGVLVRAKPVVANGVSSPNLVPFACTL